MYRFYVIFNIASFDSERPHVLYFVTYIHVIFHIVDEDFHCREINSIVVYLMHFAMWNVYKGVGQTCSVNTSSKITPVIDIDQILFHTADHIDVTLGNYITCINGHIRYSSPAGNGPSQWKQACTEIADCGIIRVHAVTAFPLAPWIPQTVLLSHSHTPGF